MAAKKSRVSKNSKGKVSVPKWAVVVVIVVVALLGILVVYQSFAATIYRYGRDSGMIDDRNCVYNYEKGGYRVVWDPNLACLKSSMRSL